MSLNVKTAPKAGRNRVNQPTLEPATYPARVAQIIDFGVQPQRPYKGKDKPPAHEISLSYELLDAFMVDENGKELEDKPRWISETFALRNIDADLAKSTKRYMALDPNMDAGGDFTRLIGTPCLVTVAVNTVGDKVYENVSAVTPMRAKEAEKAVELKNTPRVFTLDDPDMKVWETFPDWIKKKIKENLEFRGSKLENALVDSVDADEQNDGDDESTDEDW